MTHQELSKLHDALLRAFIEAIQKIGLENFKKTSMFGSNK